MVITIRKRNSVDYHLFQRRPGYQKIHYIDYKEFHNREGKEDVIDSTKDKSKDKENLFFSHTMSMKAYKKWKRFRKVIKKSIDYAVYY